MRHQVWLTKDEHMTPQILSPNHERGFYVVWDPEQWRKERVRSTRKWFFFLSFSFSSVTNVIGFQRELTLFYGDLNTTLGQSAVP